MFSNTSISSCSNSLYFGSKTDKTCLGDTVFVQQLSVKRFLNCDITVFLKFITTSISSSFIFKCFSNTFEISGLTIDTGEYVSKQKIILTTCNGFNKVTRVNECNMRILSTYLHVTVVGGIILCIVFKCLLKDPVVPPIQLNSLFWFSVQKSQ